MESAQLPLLLKPKDAATVLAISPRKLWSLTASGKVPHIRVGRAIRYPHAALLEWIAAETTNSSSA